MGAPDNGAGLIAGLGVGRALRRRTRNQKYFADGMTEDRDHRSPVCSATCGSGIPRRVRMSLALVAACPAWQLLKKMNVFCVFWFRSRILSAHSLSSASE